MAAWQGPLWCGPRAPCDPSALPCPLALHCCKSGSLESPDGQTRHVFRAGLFASCGSSNKCPPTRWLKTTGFPSVAWLEVPSPRSISLALNQCVNRVAFPLEAPGQKLFLASSLTVALPPGSASIFTSPPLCGSSPSASYKHPCGGVEGPLGNPGNFLYLKSLSHTCKTFSL